MRIPLVAGNWKLNNTSTQAYKLVVEMIPVLRTIRDVEILVCPPFTALMAVSRLTRDTNIRLGAQNMYWEASGAFTGEISPIMIAEFCQYVILGHSERRAYFGETDNAVNRKVHAALAAGLRPVVCVGETLEENETGRASGVVSRQVREALLGVDLLDIDKLVIAYEPVWAIGTGKAAAPDGVNTLLADIVRGTLRGMFTEAGAQAVRILYGGSVNPENAASFFRQPEIDGALVGGASLKAASFVALVEAAQR
ncbi:MAG: triose-phosphate isomerase [Anaerolineales bacterium]|nr:triose-phosphate isomerase [Anaerolineales bacterium]